MFKNVENLILIFVGLSSLFVILVNNPIQSLLWLILVFILSSFIFMILGVEFLSLLILMVYVGAITVLFLFVIMMLNVKIVELRQFYLRYISVGSFVVMFFIIELFFSLYLEYFLVSFYNLNYIEWIFFVNFKGNIFLFGYVIYNLFSYYFFIIALILFAALVCSIVLVGNWFKSENRFYNDIYFYGKEKLYFLK